MTANLNAEQVAALAKIIPEYPGHSLTIESGNVTGFLSAAERVLTFRLHGEDVARYAVDIFGSVRPLQVRSSRERIAVELDRAGWPSVAATVRAGMPLDDIAQGLRALGEGESEAMDIVTGGGGA